MLIGIMGRIRNVVISVLSLATASCASTQNAALELSNFEAALAQPGVVSLPYTAQKHGLVLIDNIEVNGTALTFGLDTGATHSAIFKAAMGKAKLTHAAQDSARIHGMVISDERNIVLAENFSIGVQGFGQTPLVVLDDRDLGALSWQSYDGIIGMDILQNYKLYFSKNAAQLKLIPSAIEVPIPKRWKRVELSDVNYSQGPKTLHTLDIDLEGRPVPALLDTGAEFSVLNWKAVKNSEIQSVRRRLKKQWQAQGAIGTFRPVSKANIDSLRSGEKHWADREFIVMSLNDIQIFGGLDKPFAIAGMNLLWDETLLIDFEENYIALEPRGDENRRGGPSFLRGVTTQ